MAVAIDVHESNGAAKPTLRRDWLPDEVGQFNAVVRQLLSLPCTSKSAGVAVGITGLRPGDGVTTVTTNLAVSAAAGHQETLLIEFNMGRPDLSRRLGARRGPGWQELLSGSADLGECVRRTNVDGLMLLPAKATRREDLVAISSKQFAECIDSLRDRFTLILVDLPPVGDLGACCHFLQCLDGVLMVINGMRATNLGVANARRQLDLVQADLLGAIINRHREYVPRWLGGRG